jgi:hypothetical protein
VWGNPSRPLVWPELHKSSTASVNDHVVTF